MSIINTRHIEYYNISKFFFSCLQEMRLEKEMYATSFKSKSSIELQLDTRFSNRYATSYSIENNHVINLWKLPTSSMIETNHLKEELQRGCPECAVLDDPYLLTAFLFHAFSIESFINYALREKYSGNMVGKFNRLTSVDKWLLGIVLPAGEKIEQQGEYLLNMRRIFKLRNNLVHDKPLTNHNKTIEMNQVGRDEILIDIKHEIDNLMRTYELLIEKYKVIESIEPLDQNEYMKSIHDVVMSAKDGWVEI